MELLVNFFIYQKIKILYSNYTRIMLIFIIIYLAWLCLKHSKEFLKNEEEKKTLIIDVKPLFGKNP